MAVAFGGGFGAAPTVGAILRAVVAGGVGPRTATRTDLSRRAFLRGAGATGLGLVAAGAGIGRVVQRTTRPDPGPVIRRMARGVGSEGMTFLKRGHFAGRSGDLQL